MAYAQRKKCNGISLDKKTSEPVVSEEFDKFALKCPPSSYTTSTLTCHCTSNMNGKRVLFNVKAAQIIFVQIELSKHTNAGIILTCSMRVLLIALSRMLNAT